MARGSSIIVNAQPRGVFEEVIVVGTPKPGTVMNIVRSTAAVNGRFSAEPAGTTAASGVQGMAADGNRLPICVLLEDSLQGKTADDAYVTGTQGRVYYPAPGEDLNMIVENQSGTTDDFVIGDKLIVDDGTGKLLISASTPESEPFICLETFSDLAADRLTWVKYTGY